MHPFIFQSQLYYLDITRYNKTHFSKYYVVYVKCEISGHSIKLELPLTVHETHLINVIAGACLATLISKSNDVSKYVLDEVEKKRILDAILACNFVFAPSSPEEEKFNVEEDIVKLIPNKDFCIEYKIYNGQLHLLQLNVVKQWHGGACGYHALFNILQTLRYASNPVNYDLELNASAVQHFEFNIDAQEENLLNNERYLWKQILAWNILLQKANRFVDLQCGILDEVHLRYIVANEPELKGRISIMVNDTMGPNMLSTLTEQVYAKFRVNQKRTSGEFFLHGFILGCSVHWVGAVIGISRSNPALSFVIFCDSHNAPVIQFIKKSHDLKRMTSRADKAIIPSIFRTVFGKGEEDEKKRKSSLASTEEIETTIVRLHKSLFFSSPEALADELLKRYKFVWMHKLRIVNPEYKEYPVTKLLEFFEKGMKEYHKGKPKHTLWWTHRPLELRKNLMIVEFEAGVAFLEALREMCFEVGQRFWEIDLVKQNPPSSPANKRKKSEEYRAKLKKFEEEEVQNSIIEENLDCTLSDFVNSFVQAISEQEAHEMAKRSTNRVNIDWTSTSTNKRYVREEKYIPRDDPRYLAGTGINNRIEPPREELSGDVFDRQRVIVKFNQRKIESLVCLVVGCGGLGMNVATCLARLGVAKIILLDYDTVEPSNLTRQCLASISDAHDKKPKVLAAKDNLQNLHNLRSTIEAYSINVVKEFDIVVRLTSRSDAIFNCVDCGVMFDYCLNSLSKSYEKLLISGQSFSWKYMTEMYSGKPKYNCAFCEDVTLPNFGLGINKKNTLPKFVKHLQENELELDPGNLLDFMAKDDQFLLIRSELSFSVIEEAVKTMDSLKPTEENILAFLSSYHDIVVQKLLPSNIFQLKSLDFVPFAKQLGTRFFGSFISPCMGCANLMVSNLSNVVTGSDNYEINYKTNPETKSKVVEIINKKTIPATSVFNLDDAVSENEKMAYEMYKLIKQSFPTDQEKETPEQLQELGNVFKSIFDAEDRRYFNTCSTQKCLVCRDGLSFSKYRKNLYFGDKPCKLLHTTGAVLQRSTFTESPTLGEIPSESLDYTIQVENEDIPLVQNVLPASPLQVRKLINPDIVNSLPEELLLSPIVKFDINDERYKFLLESENFVEGICSGKRSCIIHMKGKTYRLKGCGNANKQFNAESFGNKGEFMLRGCMFEETALRAIFMTEHIEKALESVDSGIEISCANIPAGIYRYDNENVSEINNRIKPNFQEIILYPYCALFETKGDRRLSDHLLGGLYSLLPYIFQDLLNDNDNLESFISEARSEIVKIRGNDWSTAINAECHIAAHNLEELYMRLLTKYEFIGFHEACSNKDFLSKIDSDYEALFLANLSELETSKGTLLEMFKNVSLECAQFLKIIHEKNISWGTYPDDLGIHCNAHGNNLVVRMNRAENESILCPLDFDMAFEREQFEADILDKFDQKLFPRSFSGILDFELKQGLRMSLAGSEFANTGVKNEEILKTSLTEQQQDAINLIKIIIRDTMVALLQSHYNSSIKTKRALPERSAYSMNQIDSLIRVALVVTSNVVC